MASKKPYEEEVDGPREALRWFPSTINDSSHNGETIPCPMGIKGEPIHSNEIVRIITMERDFDRWEKEREG